MAKQPDDFDPFDDFGSDIDDADIDSLRIDDADDIDVDVDDADVKTAIRPRQETVYRPRPTIGQIIVGLIQVILFAVIFLAIFLAVGFGAVFGGQKVGLVPTRAPGGSGMLISLLPTAGAPPSNTAPTEAPQEAPTAVPAAPTATIDIGCVNANDWWNSQQIQSNYQYFAGAAINDARTSDRIPALLEQMRIKRSFVDSYQPNGKPLDACLTDAKAALLKAFDATIEAARAIGAKDDATFQTQQGNATAAFNEMATDLRKYGVAVDLTVVATPAA